MCGVQDFDILFLGKTHIFPYEIGAYKQNRYVVDPLWRGLTVGYAYLLVGEREDRRRPGWGGAGSFYLQLWM